MAIISIARESGAYGDEIGEMLAQRLPGTLLNKELVEKRFKEFDVNPKTLQRYDERRPGFWASFSSSRMSICRPQNSVVPGNEQGGVHHPGTGW